MKKDFKIINEKKELPKLVNESLYLDNSKKMLIDELAGKYTRFNHSELIRHLISWLQLSKNMSSFENYLKKVTE